MAMQLDSETARELCLSPRNSETPIPPKLDEQRILAVITTLYLL